MRYRGCKRLELLNQLAFAISRHARLAQRCGRHRRLHGHKEVCGCRNRLTSQQVRVTSVDAIRDDAKQCTAGLIHCKLVIWQLG